VNYSKWDSICDSDDSDDDPSPARAPPVVNGIVPPPSSSMSDFEQGMLKDPRLLEAARLIELGKQTGDMALLKQAERLTHEALASNGLSEDQISRMLNNAPVAAPAASKAPSRGCDKSKPLNTKAAKTTMASGLKDLEAKQRQIEAEQEKLRQLEEAGGPEAFFEYMREQGLSEDDITRMLSGDTSVMEAALAAADCDLDAETIETIRTVESVADEVHQLSKEELQQRVRQERHEFEVEELEDDEPSDVGPKAQQRPQPAPAPKPSPAPKRARIPSYSVELIPAGLRVTVQLPGVASVSDIDLDVTRMALALDVPDIYHLDLKLPKPVDEDEVAAKWLKQESALEILCELE